MISTIIVATLSLLSLIAAICKIVARNRSKFPKTCDWCGVRLATKIAMMHHPRDSYRRDKPEYVCDQCCGLPLC